MKIRSAQTRFGFTLIEVLISLGIISILSVIILIALDPITRFAEARDARRWSDVDNILTAVTTHTVKNSQLPPGITTQEQQLGTATTNCNQACPNAENKCLDLSSQLRPFFSEMPYDLKGSAERTGYSIKIDEYHIVTVKACYTEGTTPIKLSR